MGALSDPFTEQWLFSSAIGDDPASEEEMLDTLEGDTDIDEVASSSAGSEIAEEDADINATNEDGPSEDFVSASAKGALATSCTTPWFSSYHRWKYSGLSGAYMKSRMWIKSSAFWGFPSNPDACGRPINRQAKIRHYGAAYAKSYGNFSSSAVMVKMDNTAPNASWMNSYKKEKAYGSAARKVRCGKSTHEYTSYRGRKNSWSKYSGRGCAG